MDHVRHLISLVLDPASLPVSRKARRAKTDRLDAAGMVRAMMAFDRGEPSAMSPVRVPSVEEEDRRRLLRERRRLVKQRTMLANSAKGLLMLHGVFDLDPRKRDFTQRLDASPEDDGEPGTMIARLVGLRGVGANDAVLLVREVFCRGFRTTFRARPKLRTLPKRRLAVYES